MNPRKVYYDIGYEAGVRDGKLLLLSREHNMQCLKCGVAICKEVLDAPGRLHLCGSCLKGRKRTVKPSDIA